jgi:hypothetical protein
LLLLILHVLALPLLEEGVPLNKAIMEDESLSISKYDSCRNYLSKMIENAKAEKDCKMKANLLFSTHCFGEHWISQSQPFPS